MKRLRVRSTGCYRPRASLAAAVAAAGVAVAAAGVVLAAAPAAALLRRRLSPRMVGLPT